jgi:hypothetical protein
MICNDISIVIAEEQYLLCSEEVNDDVIGRVWEFWTNFACNPDARLGIIYRQKRRA